MLSMRPAATGLRTKRTQRVAGKIGGEAALPGDQRRVFEPADGAADPFAAGAFGRVAFGVRGHDVECSSARRTTARTRSRR